MVVVPNGGGTKWWWYQMVVVLNGGGTKPHLTLNSSVTRCCRFLTCTVTDLSLLKSSSNELVLSPYTIRLIQLFSSRL